MITRVFKLLLELIVLILGLLFCKFLDYVVDGVVAPIFKEIIAIIGSSRKKKTKQFISTTKKKKTKQFLSTTKKKKIKQFTSTTQENNSTQLIANEEIRPQSTIDVTTANFSKANELGQVYEKIISQSNLESAAIVAATDDFPEANKLGKESITKKKKTEQSPPTTEKKKNKLFPLRAKDKKTKQFSLTTKEKKSKQFLFGLFKKKPKQLTLSEEIGSFPNFDIATIIAATDNFSLSNKLGVGGFGSVYKGRLPDGREIAVKRLSMNSSQGAKEFRNEVLLIAKLQHRNVICLFGYCLAGEETLLIYEYMPNGSLNSFLFDPAKRATLDWESRYKIIGGIARGVLYLHEDSRIRIIHRDLKPSNILLDEEKNPKISDFGLSRLFGAYQTEELTDRIAGTYGYMAPEVMMHGQFSIKSDVFSFGVLLLEILTSQKNNSFHQSHQRVNLTTYAWRKWSEGRALDLIDSTMSGHVPQSEAVRCIHIALLCIQEDAAARPPMSTIVVMLSSSSVSLPAPSSPAYFDMNRMASDDSDPFTKTTMSTPYSRNKVSVTDLYSSNVSTGRTVRFWGPKGSC